MSLQGLLGPFSDRLGVEKVRGSDQREVSCVTTSHSKPLPNTLSVPLELLRHLERATVQSSIQLRSYLSPPTLINQPAPHSPPSHSTSTPNTSRQDQTLFGASVQSVAMPALTNSAPSDPTIRLSLSSFLPSSHSLTNPSYEL